MSKEYTPEEIAEFRARDVRISKSGIIQALIQSSLFSKTELLEPIKDNILTATAEMYLQWVWATTTADIEVEKARTNTELRLMDVIFDKYKKQNTELTEKSYKKLCELVLHRFGKYPTKESSIDIVVKEISIEDIV